MYLKACFPGVSPDDVLANMGFKIDIERAQVTPEPTPGEISILNEKCAPRG